MGNRRFLYLNRRFLYLLLGIAWLARAYAQTTTGILFGIVRDSTGAVVPQAQVTATQVTTSFARNTTTDGSGAYLITNLPVGQYSVSVENRASGDSFRRASLWQ